ncbi:MAG: tRNA (guanosine(37)-N1)-methyltransferase TrmD [Oscillospiraceae bacterium]
MRFDILTLFPEMFYEVLDKSIIGRAKANGLVEINYIQIRDFSTNKHNKVDDYPYGGGAGMVMQAQPIYDAYMSILEGLDYKPFTIYMSPQGKTFRQGTAKKLLKHDHIVLLCGHYEGVDQRVLDEIIDAELSLGDFVMTGGEICAMAVVDTVSRLIPGVLACEDAFSEESHYHGLLEYPQYTRPEIWRESVVPSVLLSGHHKNICAWKREMSIVNTLKKRPGMLSKINLSDKELEMVNNLKNDKSLS